jgi:anti-sigma B factor antagonist
VGSSDVAARRPIEMTLLELTVVVDVDGCQVQLRGDLDLCSAPLLEENLAALRDNGCRDVTIDISRLKFCDCSGLNVLLKAHAALQREGGGLSLAGITRPVQRILELTGMADGLGGDDIFLHREGPGTAEAV